MSSAATYPVSTIAKLLLLTERRVQQLTKEGVIPKADRGRYELVPAVQGYVKYLKDRAIGADATGGDEDHKRRLIKARADIAEMESERLSGALVEVEKVEKTWNTILSRVKPKFLSVAPKAAPVVAVETNIDACHQIIQQCVNEALDELSNIEVERDEDNERANKLINEDNDEEDAGEFEGTSTVIQSDQSGSEDFITTSEDDGGAMGRQV